MKHLLAPLLLASVARAQAPLVSTVSVKLDAPGGTRAAVRVWLTGTGGLPGMNEFELTDDRASGRRPGPAREEDARQGAVRVRRGGFPITVTGE